jgi:hypothetical protein
MASLRYLLSAVLISRGLSAQTPTRDQQRLADLQFVATQLPGLHPNFFFQLNPADFNVAVQSLTAQISNLTDDEFAVRLAQLAFPACGRSTRRSRPGSPARSPSMASRERPLATPSLYG